MKFINFTIVKFCFFLVLGILSAHFFSPSTLILPILLINFCIVIILWLWSKKQLFQSVYFGIATYLCIFFIGIFSYQSRLPQFRTAHYSNLNIESKSETIQLKILQNQKPDQFYFKYFSEVNAINGKRTEGKILLNILRESVSTSYNPGQSLLVYAPISQIPKPLNPHQFDYSRYMELQGVYGQIRISKKEILASRKGKASLMAFAQNLRSQLLEKLQKTKLKSDERAIVQALVLGEKRDIDKNLYNDYAAAGAVHILAVSGLHVGILYFILSFLLKPLRIGKGGNYIHVLLVVLLLWAFAMLSGLSASVTRAVTMFSFFAVAKIFNRPTNTLNTLFLSFFTLLVINPLWFFQVGFQLSYLAVFFIVWLQPIFRKIGYPKYWLLRKGWTITAVTLSAQIGVLPLSVYYFHQFPGLFLLTNIVILPFLTVLMCGGILIVLLASFEILPNWLAYTYNYLVEGLNTFIHWVAQQEDFLFRNIHFSLLKVLGAYIAIITLALFLKKIVYGRLVALLIGVAVFVSIYIYDDLESSKNQLVIFQKSRNTLIGYKNGRNFTLFSNSMDNTIFEKYPINSFKSETNLKVFSIAEIPKIFRYNDKTLLVVDSFGIIPKYKNIHTIVLIQSPKINLSRVIDSLRPRQIIADGSNFASFASRWEKTCKIKKLPFNYTAKQGAFPVE